TLLISLVIQRYSKLPYWKAMVSIGIVLNVINFVLIPRIDFIPMFMILGLTAVWGAIFFGIHKISFTSTKLKRLKDIFTKENVGLLTAHMHDASATFVAMTFFGYLEQHPLPRMLIEMTNPGAMFALKLVVMIPVLYAIDKYAEDGQFKTFLKIVILILGLAPGLRDMIRLMVAV
ncbi:MAG: DUF63 family protein, partial [Candidatus Aenigmarchaeota archaeon]|nr:DUF63 family protein [Candidatus Aenigmarchaeota archaeon]